MKRGKGRRSEWVVPPNERVVAECLWRGRRIVMREWDEHRHVCDHPKETRPDGWSLSMVAYEGSDGRPTQFDGMEFHLAGPGPNGGNRCAMHRTQEFLKDLFAAYAARVVKIPRHRKGARKGRRK